MNTTHTHKFHAFDPNTYDPFCRECGPWSTHVNVLNKVHSFVIGYYDNDGNTYCISCARQYLESPLDEYVKITVAEVIDRPGIVLCLNCETIMLMVGNETP